MPSDPLSIFLLCNLVILTDFISTILPGPWFNAMKHHVQNRRGTVLSQVDMQYLPN